MPTKSRAEIVEFYKKRAAEIRASGREPSITDADPADLIRLTRMDQGYIKEANSRLESLKRRRFGGLPGYNEAGEKIAAAPQKQDELNTLIDRSRSKFTLKSESHLMPKTAFLAGFRKAAEVSKADLKAVLKKHEERETPAQEAAESPAEQKLEREAGVEKHAMHGQGTQLADALIRSGVFKKGPGRVARFLANVKARGHAAGKHFDRNADRYLAGVGTAAAVSGAHSGKRSADAREKQVEHFTKKAFVGFEKAAGLFSSFHSGFDPKTPGVVGRARLGMTSGNVIPVYEHVKGDSGPTRLSGEYALMSDKGTFRNSHYLSPRLKKLVHETPEGQAALRAFKAHKPGRTKEASALEGFEKAAALFNIKHELDVGKDVAKTLHKLRNLRGHHLAAGGALAGLGLGGGFEAGRRIASIGKKNEPKPAE